jgi:hypothetical protein
MAKFNARRIEDNRAHLLGDFFDLTGRHKQEFRFAVNEAGDEPRTGDAVNVDVGTGDPLHVNSFFVIHFMQNVPNPLGATRGFLEKLCLAGQTLRDGG